MIREKSRDCAISFLKIYHLNKVPCWEAEVPDDIECYDCNWEKLITISDPDVQWGGCYILRGKCGKLGMLGEEGKRHSKYMEE